MRMYMYGTDDQKDLLEELDLEVPETIDEWHDVLTALKENGVRRSAFLELW